MIDSEQFRYEMCNEIENIRKEKNVDRNIFHEVGKLDYQKVIKKLYYTFCNYQKYPAVKVSSYMWTRFRDGLKRTELIRTDWNNWDTYIDNIMQLIDDKNTTIKYYLLVDGGWVYEGIMDGIIQILRDYPVTMEDFYIFPKDYSWLIIHCDDGECMFKIWK